jgi:hypothetical protein
MRFHGRQELADFGGNGVVVQNQAPNATLDRTGLDSLAQAARDKSLHRF